MTNIASTAHTLGQLNPEEIANLVEASADISLTLNSAGVIQSIAFGNPDLRSPNLENWVGKSWIDMVTVESRPKIQALLTDANESSLSSTPPVSAKARASNRRGFQDLWGDTFIRPV